MGFQVRRIIQKSVQGTGKRFAEKIAEADRKASEYLSDLVSLRRAYLTTYLGWFAEGGSPESQGLITSMEAIEIAACEFKNRLTILDNRVEKDARHFHHPELLYGALRWLATTYHDAKTGVSCPNLDGSCRRASGFRYTAHQSDITMGQYACDYEIIWRGKVVRLREHVGFGTIRDPRHTIRVAFLFDKTRRVIVGYIGPHQQTRAT